MTRLARALLYRRIYQTVPGLPLGTGVLMHQISRLSGHADYFWRFFDEQRWRKVPIENLGLLPRCNSRAELLRLLAGGAR